MKTKKVLRIGRSIVFLLAVLIIGACSSDNGPAGPPLPPDPPTGPVADETPKGEVWWDADFYWGSRGAGFGFVFQTPEWFECLDLNFDASNSNNSCDLDKSKISAMKKRLMQNFEFTLKFVTNYRDTVVVTNEDFTGFVGIQKNKYYDIRSELIENPLPPISEGMVPHKVEEIIMDGWWLEEGKKIPFTETPSLEYYVRD